ncbi:MAG: type II toxin-antitoxin system VapC family toxin [Chloroflexota bacterium]
MVIFVDSSALLALVDQADRYYEAAMSTWRDLLTQDEDLVVNNYVLVESMALAQRRIGLEAVHILQDSIVPFLDIEWVDEDMHQASVKRVLSSNRRQLSLVDCSSFETMRRLGLDTVFTFDAHFREQGFNIIP